MFSVHTKRKSRHFEILLVSVACLVWLHQMISYAQGTNCICLKINQYDEELTFTTMFSDIFRKV